MDPDPGVHYRPTVQTDIQTGSVVEP